MGSLIHWELLKTPKMKKICSLVTVYLAFAVALFEAKTKLVENQWERGSGSIYYLKGSLPMNRYDAQDWCVPMGGNLAEPRSPEETLEINELIGNEKKKTIGLDYMRYKKMCGYG